MASFKKALKGVGKLGGDLLDRGLDRQVRLAVTGLAGSGKTAFITALVNQLEHACSDARLPLWETARSGRLLGARRVPQRNAHIPSFPFEPGMATLLGDPPGWPEPTRGVTEIRLEIRYRSTGFLRRRLADTSTLYLDIVDYPGEWLLDLPLLGLDYAQWSAQVQESLREPALRALARNWIEPAPEAGTAFQDTQAVALAAAYTEYLHACKNAGFNLIQPGRFVLPGESAGAPMLQFVPWVWTMPSARPAPGSLYAELARRYEQYKEHLVRGFYQQHFAGFDRQIVLVDCLRALDSGAQGFADTRRSVARIMESFAYGKSNWWRRLFAPRIDKLLFVASKADHVAPQQHENLVSLLQHLVHSSRGNARFEGIDTDCMALASVRATEAVNAQHHGREVCALRGITLDGKRLVVVPGEVPAAIPGQDWWQQREGDFDAFRPPPLVAHKAMPHIRLDAALNFLLGDKMA